ncbi:MAG: HicB family protein [Candidatus Methanogaster sp.]|uniref:HicB family protein n=1 Tax=Candidatus Methanogaster sp. TaxID=3386292 RepID=A0AC61L3I2_9EURY|nr:MAG: HicB family protein [ANME-2 cluster archaeon]
MKFNVVISEGEDGWYVVECSSLPGCISQGKTVPEALENIKEAIELYLEPEQDIEVVTGGRMLEVAV